MSTYIVTEITGDYFDGPCWAAIAKDPPHPYSGIAESPQFALANLLQSIRERERMGMKVEEKPETKFTHWTDQYYTEGHQ